jgi:galactose-1-phosphate uridylyltransferase
MGLSQSTTTESTLTHKGVTYDKRRRDDTSHSESCIQDCLFCRIIENREENGAPLWYKDDQVAAFIPRSPAAQIHILVVPLLHRKNLHEINVENVRMSTSQLKTIPPTTKESITDLLDHMHHVAKELVQYAIDNAEKWHLLRELRLTQLL